MSTMTDMYPTFQAFRPNFDALANVAYYKIVPKPSSKLKHSLHSAYRVVIWILVITYNLQHVIRVVQARHSTEQIVNTLFVLLTTLNTLGKQLAFNVRSWRMDRIIATIQGPLFAARNTFDETVMRANAREMSRLLMLYHGAIYVCGVFFGLFPVVNKLTGGEAPLTGYFPFDTSGWKGFSIAVAFNTIVLTMQAYGNVTLDCTIVAFYAQAKIQLQMLRNSLEHLVDPIESASKIHVPAKVYNDIENPAFGLLLKKRLTRCVEHYKLIVWFTKEVEAVFGEAMVVQFFVMAWVICMTLYKIAGLNMLSVEFVTMLIYLGCMLAQLFIYCFYGTQVKYESEFINISIYRSEWMSLSPRFRSLLLVVMARGTRPVTPRTAYIIPMSLETYIAVIFDSAQRVHLPSEWMSVSPRFRSLLLVVMARGTRPVTPRTAYIIPMSLETYIAVIFDSAQRVHLPSEWMSVSPRFRSLLLVVMARGTRPVTPRTAYIIPMSLETYIAVIFDSAQRVHLPSEWMSLSPRFRSLLLVVMARGTRPVTPRTAYIIPMSLETYIAVIFDSAQRVHLPSEWMSLSPRFRSLLLVVMAHGIHIHHPCHSRHTYHGVLRSSYTLFTFLERK